MSGLLDSNIPSIDPRLIQSGSPLEPLYQIHFEFPGAPLDGFTPNSSPALFDYQNNSPAQATVYAPNHWQVSGHVVHNPNYQRYPVRQERQPLRAPRGREPYRWANTSDFVSSLPPPSYQRTHRNERGRTVADHWSMGRYVCVCEKAFKRWGDLKRHLESSRGHNKDPRGPACPVSRCRHPGKFTRTDNFKAHYMKQHGASSDEADAYIQEWKNRGMP